MCDPVWNPITDEIEYPVDCEDPACASSVTHAASQDRPR